MKLKKSLITGGAGFIGSNLAKKLLGEGFEVTIYDNFSRQGSRQNVRWLKQQKGSSRLRIINGDIEDYKKLSSSITGCSTVFHLAGQVAVTSSLKEPVQDFRTNALGTLNVLEAARHSTPTPSLIFASTNKIYGDLSGLSYQEQATRYEPKDQKLRKGISSTLPLAPVNPYGCSKAAADSYVSLYCKQYNLPTVIFRMSCIYGSRQFGTEDQGWLYFLGRRVLQGEQFTIYGNGKQVRDVLEVNDLVDAYLAAVKKITITSGKVYNIGGGLKNSLSLLEATSVFEKLCSKKAKIVFKDWRPDDQKFFVSDNASLTKDIGWKPTIEMKEGIIRLSSWIEETSVRQ